MSSVATGERLDRRPSVPLRDSADASLSTALPNVSVIIPTYNESANIGEVVERTLTALRDTAVEIIVVDDDSPDLTWQRVRDAYRHEERVRVVRRRNRTGLASAVVRGFDEARYEVCAVLDADLQHPPEMLPTLLAPFDSEVDLVIGSRYVDGGGVEGWSLARRVVSRGATVIARLALPSVRRLSDPLSGFFAVRKSLVDDVRLQPTGYKVLLEILTMCRPDRVVEVPYVFSERKRGRSKLTAFQYVTFLTHVLTLRTRAGVRTRPRLEVESRSGAGSRPETGTRSETGTQPGTDTQSETGTQPGDSPQSGTGT